MALNDEVSLKLVARFTINCKSYIAIINNKGKPINEFMLDYSNAEEFKNALSNVSQILNKL